MSDFEPDPQDRTYTVREVFAMGAFRFALVGIALLGVVSALAIVRSY